MSHERRRVFVARAGAGALKRQRRFNYMVQEGKGGFLAVGTFGPVYKCLNTDTYVDRVCVHEPWFGLCPGMGGTTRTAGSPSAAAALRSRSAATSLFVVCMAITLVLDCVVAVLGGGVWQRRVGVDEGVPVRAARPA